VPRGKEAGGRPEPDGGGPGRMIEERKAQFLVAARQGLGAPVLGPDEVAKWLHEEPDVEVVGTLALRGTAVALGEGAAPARQTVIVARMTPQKAEAIRHDAGGRLIVENDALLTFATPELDPRFVEIHDPGVIVPHATGFTAAITVMGDGNPIKDAEVYLFGSIWPTHGVTDAKGRVELTVFGESPASITGLYVRPRADHWSYWLKNPAIEPDQEHVVNLTALSRTFPNFPARQLVGWGERIIGLDRLPAEWRGQGVKIALIDSGAATTHRNLNQIRTGFDFINKNDQSWTEDLIGHGSHSAGIIAGLDSGTGVRGFAPAAEIHVCRLFPGGRFSHLIAALDYCMEKGVDVMHLGLGCSQASELLDQRLLLAKQLGVACIAAAGNSAGPVQFPAASPHVLAVAAMGEQGEFPPDSYHANLVLDGAARKDLFSAKFTSFGPEVDLVAPGVAVVSCAPPDRFAARDGTSVAASHVTGMAALILAHHPDFVGPFHVRSAQRVERLFQILKETARPLDLGHPERMGAGLPDAVRALNLQPAVGVAPEMPIDLGQLRTMMRQAGLLGGEAVGAVSVWEPTGPLVIRGPAVIGSAPLSRMPPKTGNGGMAGFRVTLESLRAAMHEAAAL
jgi:hypothetical protein